MPGGPLTPSSTVMCPHGGKVNLIPTQARVLTAQGPIVLLNDAAVVAGCPFMVPAGPAMKPQPCIRVQWFVGSARAQVNGQPCLVQTSTGLCFSAEGIPGGPPVIVNADPRVSVM